MGQTTTSEAPRTRSDAAEPWQAARKGARRKVRSDLAGPDEVFEYRHAREEGPAPIWRRALGAVGLVAAVIVAGAVIAATLAAVGHLLNQTLAGYLSRP